MGQTRSAFRLFAQVSWWRDPTSHSKSHGFELRYVRSDGLGDARTGTFGTVDSESGGFPFGDTGGVVVDLFESERFEPARGSSRHGSQDVVSVHHHRLVPPQPRRGCGVETAKRIVDRTRDGLRGCSVSRSTSTTWARWLMSSSSRVRSMAVTMSTRRFDCGSELAEARRPGIAVVGHIHPAGQADWRIWFGERIDAVDEDGG
jgi:hypothetical protein